MTLGLLNRVRKCYVVYIVYKRVSIIIIWGEAVFKNWTLMPCHPVDVLLPLFEINSPTSNIKRTGIANGLLWEVMPLHKDNN